MCWLGLVVSQRENDTNDLQVSAAQSHDRKIHVTGSQPIIVLDLVEFSGLGQWFHSNWSLTEEDWARVCLVNTQNEVEGK